jgi:hypothetical protein
LEDVEPSLFQNGCHVMRLFVLNDILIYVMNSPVFPTENGVSQHPKVLFQETAILGYREADLKQQ